jgi:hypothetical protein
VSETEQWLERVASPGGVGFSFETSSVKRMTDVLPAWRGQDSDGGVAITPNGVASIT